VQIVITRLRGYPLPVPVSSQRIHKIDFLVGIRPKRLGKKGFVVNLCERKTLFPGISNKSSHFSEGFSINQETK
jgi:hypothetical protein